MGLAFFFSANSANISEKIKSYSHGEFNTEDNTDEENKKKERKTKIYLAEE